MEERHQYEITYTETHIHVKRQLASAISRDMAMLQVESTLWSKLNGVMNPPDIEIIAIKDLGIDDWKWSDKDIEFGGKLVGYYLGWKNKFGDKSKFKIKVNVGDE